MSLVYHKDEHTGLNAIGQKTEDTGVAKAWEFHWY